MLPGPPEKVRLRPLCRASGGLGLRRRRERQFLGRREWRALADGFGTGGAEKGWMSSGLWGRASVGGKGRQEGGTRRAGRCLVSLGLERTNGWTVRDNKYLIQVQHFSRSQCQARALNSQNFRPCDRRGIQVPGVDKVSTRNVSAEPSSTRSTASVPAQLRNLPNGLAIGPSE